MKIKKVQLAVFAAIVLSLTVSVGGAMAAGTMFFGGPIITMEDNKQVEAIIVEDGKIKAAGDLETLRGMLKSDDQSVNLQGKTMLPGFYDAHGHFMYTGVNALKTVDLSGPPTGSIDSMAKLLAALSERAAITEPGGWVQGFGYDDIRLVEKVHPTRWDLDQVSTELPIIITHFSGHSVVVNSKALELAGITAATPDPPGGQIGHRADGEPNGQLWETAAYLVQGLLPAYTFQDCLDGIAHASQMWASKGATTGNVGASASLPLFKAASDMGYLKIRATLWFGLEAGKAAHDEMGGDRGSVKYYGDKGLVVLGGIKYFQDGSPQLRTAYLTDPYYTTGEYPADWVAYPRQTREELIQMVVDAHEAGFNQIYIHGNGDAAIDDVLAAYEEVRKPGYRQPAGPDDLRHTVIHCQISREDQFDKMATMKGVIPSFLEMHPYYLGDRHWEIFFGPERAARLSAAQDAIDRGITYTLHADSPVFPHDPLLMAHIAVNRLSWTGREIFTTTYNPGSKYRSVDQRITPEEALRGLTINAAYECGEEDVTGSIKAGKRADLVILDQNPITVDPTTIKDIKVLATIVGGELVYGSTDISGASGGSSSGCFISSMFNK